LSLSLASWNLFLLPLDVANQRGSYFATGLPMETLTLAFFCATILMVLVVVPFTIFYYEGEEVDDEDKKRSPLGQCGFAFQYIVPTILLIGCIVFAMYYFGLGYADINTAFIEAPLFDTTELEAQSIDAFYTFDFYCNSKVINTAITLNSTVPLGEGEFAPTYIPSIVGSSGNLIYGCENLSEFNGFQPVIFYVNRFVVK
jgi:hypothetical protein